MRKSTIILLLLFSHAIFSQKTDVVVVQNGNHITGEVQNLQDNMLSFKTDDMGTLRIKWDKVLHVVSKNSFRVELKGGGILLGALDSTERNGYVRILIDSSWTEVKSDEVVGILKIDQTVLGRIDGDIGIGYSYTKSSAVHSLNGKFNVSYLANKNLSEFKSNVILTNQQDTIVTSKADVVLAQTRLLKNNMFTTVSYALQQNSELGIRRRSLASLTYGKNFIKRNRMLLLFSAGVAGNIEKYYPDENNVKNPNVANLEGIVRLEFNSFSNNDPEFSVHPYIIVYPGLTDWGRLRSDINIDIKVELIHDLFFTLTYYNQFDNKPPSGSAESDFGIITSFSFSF